MTKQNEGQASDASANDVPKRALSRTQVRTMLKSMLEKFGTHPVGLDQFSEIFERLHPGNKMARHFYGRFREVQAEERATPGRGLDAVVPSKRRHGIMNVLAEAVRARYGTCPCTRNEFDLVAKKVIPNLDAKKLSRLYGRYREISAEEWGVVWTKQRLTFLSARLKPETLEMAQALREATGLSLNRIVDVLMVRFATDLLSGRADVVEMIVSAGTHGVHSASRAAQILRKINFTTDPRLTDLENVVDRRKQSVKRSAAALAQITQGRKEDE
ncbi:hypothetical protein [Noviherbaspirillum pedocola]|uniref:Uncharacterized protein n=1 Tax=Noviherbaspirillum pedocola TaxID=2801341 RepID=A0A934SUN0_9BURK|nr:hypothetical protein [Noviherbaspirillum pedocola]MBK4736027.1 hypothetical protein [Noviherbaspirillum pedocola]